MVVLYWVVISQRVPMVVFWSCQVLRLPILGMLGNYMEEKAHHPNVNVSVVATFKFILLIMMSAHYIGLMFFFFALVAGFDTSVESESWVIQFSVSSYIVVNLGESLSYENYLLCMYKGMNALTNLGYESTVPKRMEELVLSMVTFITQLVVEAYILGEPRTVDPTSSRLFAFT